MRGIGGLAALALLSLGAHTSKSPHKKPQMRHYPSPIGPPWPTTRQQRRALEREAAKPLKEKKHD